MTHEIKDKLKKIDILLDIALKQTKTTLSQEYPFNRTLKHCGCLFLFTFISKEVF